MATRKTAAHKDVQDKVKETAHRIWLAGLGAFSMAEQEGGKLYRSLIKKGEQYEELGKERFEKVRDKVEAFAETARDKAGEVAGEVEKRAGKAWSKVGADLDDAVSGALAKVGVPTKDEITRLTRRIEELTALVEKKVAGGRKPAAKRTTARKSTRKAG
jgi:poly(hydroxyalkanoate) granule-associated protein